MHFASCCTCTLGLLPEYPPTGTLAFAVNLTYHARRSPVAQAAVNRWNGDDTST